MFPRFGSNALTSVTTFQSYARPINDVSGTRSVEVLTRNQRRCPEPGQVMVIKQKTGSMVQEPGNREKDDSGFQYKLYNSIQLKDPSEKCQRLNGGNGGE